MNSVLKSIHLWFDSNAKDSFSDSRNINWLRCLPHVMIYLGCLGVFWVGVSPAAIAVCIASYCVSVFVLTGFYHRFFSHRTFKTSRAFQFFISVIGMCAAQRSPLWWAAHHRSHHRFSDTFQDKHSPTQHGFIRSHWGWFLEDRNFSVNEEYVKDLIKFPELVFLNRFDFLPPLIYMCLLYYFGGLQILVWGFFVSTVLVYQVTFAINSIAHLVGTRRYNTTDTSRNNWWLAILTFGEGWHNNHHHFPSSVKQGFRFYEIDITYYLLRVLQAVGLVWDLRVPPPEVINDTIQLNGQAASQN